MKCKKCIWNDQCGQDEPCEYYDDGSDVTIADILNYKRDLELRERTYEEVLRDICS